MCPYEVECEILTLYLLQVLVEVARSLGVKCHVRGTMLTIEGPRFSSRAESLMFRQWGADVINMTTVPEVVLAKEAGLCYASIAMATDYDCWKEHEEAVSGSMELLQPVLIALKFLESLLFFVSQCGPQVISLLTPLSDITSCPIFFVSLLNKHR